jgi:hypothetical protein
MVLTGAAGWDSGLGAGLQLSGVVLVGRATSTRTKRTHRGGRLKVVEIG